MTDVNEVWLEQMHVFPDQPDVFEHNDPYVVEYEATTGATRTRLLDENEVKSVRKFNKLSEPVSEVPSDTE